MSTGFDAFTKAASGRGETPAEGYRIAAPLLDRWPSSGRVNVPVGPFTFFPSHVEHEVYDPRDGTLIAAHETRAFVLDDGGTLREFFLGGSRVLPFTVDELLGLAAPFIGARLEGEEGERYLGRADEARCKAELESRFGAATDLLGIPLLESVRAELEGRRRSAMATIGVALGLLGGIVAIALAVAHPVMKAVVLLGLGCVPVTILWAAQKTRSKAGEALARLPN
ncbi:MAG: hypothetical protein AAF411_12635 [Myxococcota bacterium]